MTRLTVLFFATLLLAMACPKAETDPNAGSGGGGAGNGSGQNGSSTQLDVGCNSDQNCGAGEICNLDSGDCVPGFDCSQNPGICQFCGSALEDNDCGFGDAEAYCDEEAGGVPQNRPTLRCLRFRCAMRCFGCKRLTE